MGRRRGVPYGHKLDGRTGATVPDAEEQAVIDRIVREYWFGFGFDAIASNLTYDEIKAPAGGAKWHGPSVSKVWDRVTNGDMKRIEKADAATRKAEQEAANASESGQMAAELQRRQEPEVQLERTGYVEIDTSTVDSKTGDIVKESAA